MALAKIVIYWFRCDDTGCTAGSDDRGGDDCESYDAAIEKARAEGWKVTRLYAYCPEHAHRYRDALQRRRMARGLPV